jgi:hypothetical protein
MGTGETENFQLSEGEIHFLWWFIQGSIMSAGTRWQLRKAWGFCDRHAWGFIQIDAAFRRGWMHGPAILYLDLLEQTCAALNFKGPLQRFRTIRRLKDKAPCLMCEAGFGPDTIGKAQEEVIKRGRDFSELQKFARETQEYWRKAVCGLCVGSASRLRCRAHLIADLSLGSDIDLSRQYGLLADILYHVRLYANSFRMEFHGTETEEDKAALISAVGWCSGWKTFLSLIPSLKDDDL